MGLFDRFRRKPTAARTGDDSSATRHCFVLCKHAAPGGLDRLDAAVKRVFGRGYSAQCDEGATVTVNRRDDTVGFIAHMPAPVPGGEAEQNADGNFLWPNGKEEAAQHRSHVIVTNIGSGDLSPVQSALVLSRLALVALDVFDGLGVYWGNACVTNSRATFEDFCSEMSEESLPLPMWLRFQAVRAEPEQIGMYTLGMSQFGLMEIEVERSTMDLSDLFEFIANLANYLVQSGPVIADGNTVGGSEAERILVRHRPSMIDASRRVYQVVFE